MTSQLTREMLAEVMTTPAVEATSVLREDGVTRTAPAGPAEQRHGYRLYRYL